ncbi:hypothetical protein Tco_0299843 [Tanacetum coccineum]
MQYQWILDTTQGNGSSHITLMDRSTEDKKKKKVISWMQLVAKNNCSLRDAVSQSMRVTTKTLHYKPLRPSDMLLNSWDRGLDLCKDLTGSSHLKQTRMVDFRPGRVVIDTTHRKRVKYDAKCAYIGYGFLPISFSSLRELEKDAVTLLKQIRKFSVA